MTFEGACLPLCGVPVLIVIVDRPTLADPIASQRIVDRYRARFRRTIVLMAQDLRGVPTYFGPAGIVKALATLAFEAIPWRRFRVREKRRAPDDAAPMWWLPIPPPLIEGPPSSIDLSCFGPRHRPEDVAVTRDLRASRSGGSSRRSEVATSAQPDNAATCLSLRDGDAITRWTPCGRSLQAFQTPRIANDAAALPASCEPIAGAERSRRELAARRSRSQATRILGPEPERDTEPTSVGTAWNDEAVTEVSASWPR